MPKTECIYCGEVGERSKEHVVADWIHRQIKDEAAQHNIVSRNRQLDLDSQTVKFQQGNISGTGPIGAIGLRTVCKTCNSGWMSDIVQEARPFLQSIIKGCFCPAEPSHLAQWAVLTALNVASYMRDGGAVEADRRSFFRTQTIPPDWHVSVGLATGTPDRAFTHRSAAMHTDPSRQDRNVIALTLCLKRAVVHVLRMPSELPVRIDNLSYSSSFGLIPIHPIAQPPVFWLRFPAQILTVEQVRRVGTGLMDKIIQDTRGDQPGNFDDWIIGRDDQVWRPIDLLPSGGIHAEHNDWAVQHYSSLVKAGKINVTPSCT